MTSLTTFQLANNIASTFAFLITPNAQCKCRFRISTSTSLHGRMLQPSGRAQLQDARINYTRAIPSARTRGRKQLETGHEIQKKSTDGEPILRTLLSNNDSMGCSQTTSAQRCSYQRSTPKRPVHKWRNRPEYVPPHQLYCV